MTDEQEELLSHHVDHTLIKRAAQQMQTFIVCIAATSAIALLLYHFKVESLSYPLLIFVIVVITLLLTGHWFTQRLVISTQTSMQKLDRWCQYLSLGIGLCLGLAAYMITAFMSTTLIGFSYVHFLLWVILPLSIIYIFALTFLSYRPIYFLFIFAPSILPFIVFNYLPLDNIPAYFSTIIAIWFLFIICAVIVSFGYHRRMLQLNNKNILLMQQNNTQSQHTHQLRQQLRQQDSKIEEINHHLARHYNELSFTQENVGINTWNWNIEQRTLEICNTHLNLDVEYSGTQAHFIIHPEDQALYRKHMRQCLHGDTDRFELQYRVKKDQQWFWIHDVGKVTVRDPVTRMPKQMVGILRDINKEKKAYEQLRVADNLFNQVTKGLFVLDEDLRYINVNTCYEKLTGLKRNQLLGKHIFEVTSNHSDSIKKQHAEILHQLAMFGEYRTEMQEHYISGTKLNIEIQLSLLSNQDDQAIHYVGNVTDLTERKQQEQRLSYLEQYDLLTDLPNRFYFYYRLTKLIAQEDQHKFAVVRINIDRFRLFNDLYFNIAGDELLRKFAERLRKYCSHALFVAYLNNDDFVVALKISEQGANINQLAQGLLVAFQAPFYIGGQETFISISVGMAQYPEHGEQVDVLLRKAETALLKAKQLGGNTYHLFNDQAYEHLNDKTILKGDLQQALKKQQLIVYYQPQICSHSLKILGFEALIRWQHPEYGLISPSIFIPLAEETSLITEIGQFVIFESCKQLQIWRELGFKDIRVSVNIVAQQILRGQLLLDLDTAMTMYQITGKQLELELTESSLLENSNHVIGFLSKIKERNISISLDDFGMGYSSLAYLSQYPIDKLKIDKAFISRIGDQKEEAIVNAIIAMGKAMGMSLIAEGVENTNQLEYLQKQGCDVLQGFYFSKALTALETTAYLSQYKHSLVSHSLH